MLPAPAFWQPTCGASCTYAVVLSFKICGAPHCALIGSALHCGALHCEEGCLQQILSAALEAPPSPRLGVLDCSQPMLCAVKAESKLAGGHGQRRWLQGACCAGVGTRALLTPSPVTLLAAAAPDADSFVACMQTLLMPLSLTAMWAMTTAAITAMKTQGHITARCVFYLCAKRFCSRGSGRRGGRGGSHRQHSGQGANSWVARLTACMYPVC